MPRGVRVCKEEMRSKFASVSAGLTGTLKAFVMGPGALVIWLQECRTRELTGTNCGGR